MAKNDSATEFARMDAPSADPSTWLNHDEKIEYSDFYGGAGIKAILASGRTRSYFRMAPAGWHHQKPTRSQLQNIPANLRLNPLGRWSSWDGGANQVGWVSVATPPHGKAETTTVTQWFDATAEIWAFDSSIIDDVQGFKMLGIYRVMKDWQTMLGKALAFYNHLEAKPPFRVEVGLGGLNGVHWPDHLSSKRVLALESSISSDEISRDWSEDKIVDFILASATKMYDAFNQPAPSRDAVVHILRTTPE